MACLLRYEVTARLTSEYSVPSPHLHYSFSPPLQLSRHPTLQFNFKRYSEVELGGWGGDLGWPLTCFPAAGTPRQWLKREPILGSQQRKGSSICYKHFPQQEWTVGQSLHLSCCFLLASSLYFPLACCSAWFVQGCNTKGDGEEEERRKFLPDCCRCCQVTSVVSDSVRPHRRQPTRLPRPWDSPGKNTGVGCHFLLLLGRCCQITAVCFLNLSVCESGSF